MGSTKRVYRPSRGRRISIEELRAHIDRLVAEHAIVVSWCRRSNDAWGAIDIDEICIAPIKSARSYATALHEIGHIKGRFQRSRSLMVRERYAWEWARRNALFWTAWMERNRVQSLHWYEERIRKGSVSAVSAATETAGVEFTPENGCGLGGRLRKGKPNE